MSVAGPKNAKYARIGVRITVGFKKEASVDAIKNGTFCVCLGRVRVNKRNRNLWQEDYGLEKKFDTSNATHLLTL